MSDLGPGTLVECIDDSALDDSALTRGGECPFRKGGIYTVRELCVEDHRDNGVGLCFREVADATPTAIWCRCWNLKRFRPVDDDRIAIFREIVEGVKHAPAKVG